MRLHLALALSRYLGKNWATFQIPRRPEIDEKTPGYPTVLTLAVSIAPYEQYSAQNSLVYGNTMFLYTRQSPSYRPRSSNLCSVNFAKWLVCCIARQVTHCHFELCTEYLLLLSVSGKTVEIAVSAGAPKRIRRTPATTVSCVPRCVSPSMAIVVSDGRRTLAIGCPV